ncbi:hypothetical protein C2H92_10265 [Bacillus halotolerans]|nr:hypothetical protein C2H92_10265 [Bacillus halotolerans]
MEILKYKIFKKAYFITQTLLSDKVMYDAIVHDVKKMINSFFKKKKAPDHIWTLFSRTDAAQSPLL